MERKYMSSGSKYLYEEFNPKDEWVLIIDEFEIEQYSIAVTSDLLVYSISKKFGDKLIAQLGNPEPVLEAVDATRDQLAMLYLSKLPEIPPVSEFTEDIVEEFFKDAYLFADKGIKVRDHGL